MVKAKAGAPKHLPKAPPGLVAPTPLPRNPAKAAGVSKASAAAKASAPTSKPPAKAAPFNEPVTQAALNSFFPAQAASSPMDSSVVLSTDDQAACTHRGPGAEPRKVETHSIASSGADSSSGKEASVGGGFSDYCVAGCGGVETTAGDSVLGDWSMISEVPFALNIRCCAELSDGSRCEQVVSHLEVDFCDICQEQGDPIYFPGTPTPEDAGHDTAEVQQSDAPVSGASADPPPLESSPPASQYRYDLTGAAAEEQGTARLPLGLPKNWEGISLEPPNYPQILVEGAETPGEVIHPRHWEITTSFFKTLAAADHVWFEQHEERVFLTVSRAVDYMEHYFKLAFPEGSPDEGAKLEMDIRIGKARSALASSQPGADLWLEESSILKETILRIMQNSPQPSPGDSRWFELPEELASQLHSPFQEFIVETEGLYHVSLSAVLNHLRAETRGRWSIVLIPQNPILVGVRLWKLLLKSG